MNDKKPRKTNKNNIKAIAVLVSFFVLISGAYAAYELSDIHEVVRDASVEASSSKGADVSVVDASTEGNAVSSEASSKEATTELTEVSTADTQKTEQPTTETPTTEATTEKTTEATTETTSETQTATTEQVQLPEGVFSENNTILPDIVDVPCSDWYDSRYFAPDKVQDASFFDKTVFIGDSRTESLAYYTGFDNVNAFAYKGLNVGAIKTERCISINGRKYTVEEAIAATYYENYVISFGINELGWEYIDVFTDDISELVDMIYARNPKAVVYIAAVVPVSQETSDSDDIFNMENVEKFNKAIIKLCHDREDVIYTNYAAAVSDEYGFLPEEGTVDGKHCTGDYSRRIMEYILLHTYKRK